MDNNYLEYPEDIAEMLTNLTETMCYYGLNPDTCDSETSEHLKEDLEEALYQIKTTAEEHYQHCSDEYKTLYSVLADLTRMFSWIYRHRRDEFDNVFHY